MPAFATKRPPNGTTSIRILPWAKFRSPSCWAIVTLVAILLVGLALRGYRLSARSLWFDEAFTWRVSQFPLAEMVQRVGHDNSPPLYFLLLKGWSSVFGTTPLALRSLSVLLGCLTIVGTYLFTVEAFGRDAPPSSAGAAATRGREIGLLAAAFVTLSLFQIRYSWEVRMYALAATTAIFSSWALFRGLRPPSRLGRWLLYAVLALLLAYTHHYGLFTLAAQALFVVAVLLVRARWNPLAACRDPALRHALLAGVVIVAGWLPWLPTFLRQRAQVQHDYWSQPVKPGDVAQLCSQMFMEPEYVATPSDAQRDWIAAGLCLLGLGALCWKARAGAWYVAWSAVAPLLFCLLVSRYDTKVFTLRYFIIANLFVLIGLAVLVWRVPYRTERGLVAAAVLTLFLGFYVRFTDKMDVTHRPGIRAAAEFIDAQRQPGEPVVVCSPLIYFSMLYHAPDRADYYVYTDGSPIPHYFGTAALTPQDLLTDEQLQGLRVRRVWVVGTAGGAYWGTQAVPVPPEWDEKQYQMFPEVFGIGKIKVVEYETTMSPASPP